MESFRRVLELTDGYILSLFCSILFSTVYSQSPLEVYNNTATAGWDTVAQIIVDKTATYDPGAEKVGLFVSSEAPQTQGIGGRFMASSTGLEVSSNNIGIISFGSSIGAIGTGSISGLRGSSHEYYGTDGFSDLGYGIRGVSNISGTGAYFKGGGGTGIEIGGVNSIYGSGDDDCVIRSDTSQSTSDLILVSNDFLRIELDDDHDGNAEFQIRNGGDSIIFRVTESGTVYANGTLVHGSDQYRKENILPINPKEILNQLNQLDINSWSYIGNTGKHIGPMAQDFYKRFGLGETDKGIATVDADGVLMAAIQALSKEVAELKRELQQQQFLISQYKSQLAEK